MTAEERENSSPFAFFFPGSHRTHLFFRQVTSGAHRPGAGEISRAKIETREKHARSLKCTFERSGNRACKRGPGSAENPAHGSPARHSTITENPLFVHFSHARETLRSMCRNCRAAPARGTWPCVKNIQSGAVCAARDGGERHGAALDAPPGGGLHPSRARAEKSRNTLPLDSRREIHFKKY